MMPNVPAPVTDSPLIRTDSPGTIIQTIRLIRASITGPPTRSPRNADRRDHSIWPSDRSNIRRTEPG